MKRIMAWKRSRWYARRVRRRSTIPSIRNPSTAILISSHRSSYRHCRFVNNKSNNNSKQRPSLFLYIRNVTMPWADGCVTNAGIDISCLFLLFVYILVYTALCWNNRSTAIISSTDTFRTQTSGVSINWAFRPWSTWKPSILRHTTASLDPYSSPLCVSYFTIHPLNRD